MECDKVQEQLSEYLEDALSSAERDIIDSHLKSCPKCSKALAELDLTVSSLKSLDEIIPPPWLTQKIMSRVKAEAELSKKGIWQKLFYPLHVKLPIEALGLFLMALTALYVFKSMEPKINTVTTPSERTFSEYAPKAKEAKPGTEVVKPPQAPMVTPSKKDETAATGSPMIQESSPLPAQPAEQAMPDQPPPAKEKRAEDRGSAERDMLMKSAPAPAGLSEPAEVKQERALGKAGKVMSGVPEREEISILLKTGDIDSAKRGIREILARLGGRIVREEHAPDTLNITIELGPDKLQLFMDKLKTLGSVKEKTMRPPGGEGPVVIKITISKQ